MLSENYKNLQDNSLAYSIIIAPPAFNQIFFSLFHCTLIVNAKAMEKISNIKAMEKRYQGRRDASMMDDYIWCLIRDVDKIH